MVAGLVDESSNVKSTMMINFRTITSHINTHSHYISIYYFFYLMHMSSEWMVAEFWRRGREQHLLCPFLEIVNY